MGAPLLPRPWHPAGLQRRAARLVPGDRAHAGGQGLGAERGSDAGLDAVLAQQRGNLRGIDEHVLVVLAITPPGAVGAPHERGDVAASGPGSCRVADAVRSSAGRSLNLAPWRNWP